MDYYRRDPNMLWSPAPFPMLGKYIIHLWLFTIYDYHNWIWFWYAYIIIPAYIKRGQAFPWRICRHSRYSARTMLAKRVCNSWLGWANLWCCWHHPLWGGYFCSPWKFMQHGWFWVDQAYSWTQRNKGSSSSLSEHP